MLAMLKNFFKSFEERPEISYPTIVFAFITLLMCVLCIIAECNDAPLALSTCEWFTGYFAAITTFSPWVKAA